MIIEITAYQPPGGSPQPPRRRRWTSTAPRCSNRWPTAPGLRWVSDLRPHGLLTTLTPLLAVLGRRQTRRISDGLERQLETQPPAPPERSARLRAVEEALPREVTGLSDVDVIVIGAGCGGLSAGALLAGQGRRVLVVNQNDTVGVCPASPGTGTPSMWERPSLRCWRRLSGCSRRWEPPWPTSST
jgi:hypothetical protein